MIKIERPRIYFNNDTSYYSARYIDESNSFSQDIYFKVGIEWSQYFSSTADAWVILALLPAIKSGQDIYVDAPVSQDLLFAIRNSLIRLFSSIYNNDLTKPINIFSNNEIISEEQGFAVGCGCSLGIDSLSAIKRYTSESLDHRYKISHLTLFNVGAFGDNDLDQATRAYSRTLCQVKEFAKELSLPVVGVESNAQLFRDWEFEQTHTLRNLSAVFALKRLFGAYYYASSFPIEKTTICSNSMSYIDSIVLPLLSTSSLRLYVADADKNRIEKTIYIVDDPLTPKYLTVCSHDINVNGGVKCSVSGEYEYGGVKNCTLCEKCFRTLLTIDILGKLRLYNKVFDISEFQHNKKWYILRVIRERHSNFFYYDIFQLMLAKKYVVPHDAALWLLLEKMHLLCFWNVVKKTDHLYRRILGKSNFCILTDK